MRSNFYIAMIQIAVIIQAVVLSLLCLLTTVLAKPLDDRDCSFPSRKGWVPAFNYSDTYERATCVKEDDVRIVGFKMVFYVVKYAGDGDCDPVFAWNTEAAACDMVFEPPYIVLPDTQVLTFEPGPQLGPENHNTHAFAAKYQQCIVEPPEESPCLKFTLERQYFEDYQQQEGVYNDEFENIRRNRFEFYDVGMNDADDLDLIQSVRKHKRLFLPTEHIKRYFPAESQTESCISACKYIGLEFLLDFAYILKHEPQRSG